MGLSNALARLNADRALEAVVHDVLLFFREHPHTGFSAEDVARRTGRPVVVVEPVLATLARGFVLDCQTDPAAFRFDPDTLMEFEVDRYLHRVHIVNNRLQDNVARFRERHGQR